MGQYKTPGVYIVEQNAFPNSVVEVATAVPAFIGYTEKALYQGKSLRDKPWRVTSLAQFHEHFGFGPKPTFQVKLDDDGVPTVVQDGGRFLLYYGMRQFFQNGGGPCYVVSIGDYEDDSIDAQKLKDGIDALKTEQEPTMVVVPEAVLLEEPNCISVQQAALLHCGTTKSRVALLDVWGGFKPVVDCIADFRNHLGTNFLDYAAAYYPWLNTTVVQDNELNYANISNPQFLQKLMRTELGLPDAIDAQTPAKKAEQWMLIDDIIKQADAAAKKARADAAAKLAKATEKRADATEKKAAADAKVAEAGEDEAKKAEAKPFEAAAKKADEDAKQAESAATKAEAKAKKAEDAVKKEGAEGAEPAPVDANAKPWTEDDTKLLNKTLTAMSPLFKPLMTELKEQLNLLPPSPAMAGIYTMVDNSRGVWKAPANVSLNGVISPSVNLTAEDQEDLNITTQGKSINAIRSFVGEGVLVWGARTLDGNSQDWRYISVRRTMIMLEESCRLAAKAMVFEPNVANTWVTIKSMIQNFLTGVWKRGGLAGAVPDDAFSVHVGLGETMTAQDVLDGYLRVTVLVAISRPAEFIEITFQQQMQKS